MDIVEFVEKELGATLLDWQKEHLIKLTKKRIKEEKLYVIPARHNGRSNYIRLIEEFEKIKGEKYENYRN